MRSVMVGEKDLTKLLAALSPELIAGEYVFCTFENARYGEHAQFNPIASVAESEGLTLVVERQTADANRLSYASVFRCLKLGVHSSLDAVGLTAAVAGKLAEHGVSANVIAGYFHDYIFVPRERAAHALAAIGEV